MPDIDLIDPVYYNPNDPYHYLYDNLPLRKIIQRQELINLALDDVIEQMTDAVGSQGTVSNRLNQSINPDGSIKTAAIDELLHSIEAHSDTEDYVRMQRSESDKLNLIADQATNFGVKITFENDDTVEFDQGFLEYLPSDTVTFDLTTPNKVKINLAFPAEAAHRHFYDQTPVHYNIVTPDYTTYKVNSIASAYVEGSLRIYINGVRISDSASIYVPGSLVTDPWTLITYNPDESNGTFTLSTAISSEDVIRIDYDTSYL